MGAVAVAVLPGAGVVAAQNPVTKSGRVRCEPARDAQVRVVDVDAGVDDGDVDVGLVIDAVDAGVRVLVGAGASDTGGDALVERGDEPVRFDGEHIRVVEQGFDHIGRERAGEALHGIVVGVNDDGVLPQVEQRRVAVRLHAVAHRDDVAIGDDLVVVGRLVAAGGACRHGGERDAGQQQREREQYEPP